jgi:fibronectin-binding autotransporter adhesin
VSVIGPGRTLAWASPRVIATVLGLLGATVYTPLASSQTFNWRGSSFAIDNSMPLGFSGNWIEPLAPPPTTQFPLPPVTLKFTSCGFLALRLCDSPTNLFPGRDVNWIEFGANADRSFNIRGSRIDLTGGILNQDNRFHTVSTDIGVAGGITIENKGGGFTTIQGSITGPGGVRYDSTGGAIRLRNNNTYTGPTEIRAGVTVLDGIGRNYFSDTGTVQVNGNAILDMSGENETIGRLTGTGRVRTDGSTLTVQPDTFTSFGGTVEGSGGLTVDGTSEFQLTGTQRYTGLTEVAGGTLRLNGGAITNSNVSVGKGASLALRDAAIGLRVDALSGGSVAVESGGNTIGDLRGAGRVALAGGSLLEIQNTESSSFEGTFSGSGTLSLNGANGTSYTFNGAAGQSTMSGILDVKNGTARIGKAQALSNDVVVNLRAGTSLNTLGHSDTIGGLTGTGRVLNSNAVLDLNVAQGRTLDFDGVISGTGSLSTLGRGTQILSGANTYTGSTQIVNGTLKLGGNERIADSSNLYVGGRVEIPFFGSTFVLEGAFDMNGRVESVAQLSGGGRIINNNQKLRLLQNTNTTFSGAISGLGALEKNGEGTLTLSGTNTYTGNTRVTDGTVRLGGSSGNVIQDGSDLHLNYDVFSIGFGGQTLSFINEGILDMAGRAEAVGSLSGGGRVINNNSKLTVNQDKNTMFSGTIAGTGALEKRGASTLLLSGTNSYTGDTIIRQGTLRLGRSKVLADQSDLFIAGPQTSGSISPMLDMAGHSEAVGSLSGAGLIANNSQSLRVNQSGNSIFKGSINGGGRFEKAGTGQLTISSSGFADGADIHVLGGKLRLEANHATQYDNRIFISSAAGVEVAAYRQARGGSLSGNGVLDLLLGSSFSLRQEKSTSGAFAGRIEGLGSFSKSGQGIFFLSGQASHSGTTTIHEGVLALARENRLSDTSRLTMAGGTLDMRGFSDTVGSLSGNGEIINANLRVLQLAAGSFSGDISGYRFTKAGHQTLTLTGNTNVSEMTVESGKLEIADSGQVNVRDDLLITAGATLELTRGDIHAASTRVEGGRLTGIGGIYGDVLLTSGASLGPGFSPGQIDIFGDLNAIGGIFDFEIFGLSSGEFDVLNVLGDLTLVDSVFRFDFSNFIWGSYPNSSELLGQSLGLLNVTGSFSEVGMVPEAGLEPARF